MTSGVSAPTRDELIARFGTDEPLPEVVALVAGRLTAAFVAGGLRGIRYAGAEVLRAISFVVRDADWGTIVPCISELVIGGDQNSFAVSYRASYRDPAGALLRCEVRIRGDAASGLRFETSATPEDAFTTARCGFCVLHPIMGVAGQPVTVEHVDGTVEHAVFPELIAPWQPFKEIRTLTHSVAEGISATCRLDGDTFEMEDQRAWSDASYKTYVRPLALPWPYVLPASETIRQSVTLTVDDRSGWATAATASAEGDAPVTLRIGSEHGQMPAIGLLISPEDAAEVEQHSDRLAEIAPQFLLCHFDPTAAHGRTELEAFTGLRRAFPGDIVLECVVPGLASPSSELSAIAADMTAAGFKPDAIIVSPSVDRQSTLPGREWPECPPLADVYKAARSSFPDLRLGGGMLSYFTEMNRKRPPVQMLDFVTHCICPTVHAADDLSVMQTLEAIPAIIRSTRAIIGSGKPYHLGPSTIGMRQNPYGSRTFGNPLRQRITMAEQDPRQSGLFAAAWTVGYCAATSGGGIAAWTPGPMTGVRGLLALDDVLLPDGAPRPVFHVVKGLAALANRPRLTCQSSAPDRVLAVAAEQAGGQAITWLANLTDRAQRVQVRGRTTIMDDRYFFEGATRRSQTVRDELTLAPFAVAETEPHFSGLHG